MKGILAVCHLPDTHRSSTDILLLYPRNCSERFYGLGTEVQREEVTPLKSHSRCGTEFSWTLFCLSFLGCTIDLLGSHRDIGT